LKDFDEQFVENRSLLNLQTSIWSTPGRNRTARRTTSVSFKTATTITRNSQSIRLRTHKRTERNLSTTTRSDAFQSAASVQRQRCPESPLSLAAAAAIFEGMDSSLLLSSWGWTQETLDQTPGEW
jgi:hypothetical protein